RRGSSHDREDLRDRGGADRGDHPPAGFRRGRTEGDPRPGQGGTRPGRVLRRRAGGGKPRSRGAPARGAGGSAGGHWGTRTMSTYGLLSDLPLRVDGYTLEGLSAQVSSAFDRLTTVVRLSGGGDEGVGEDVVYDAVD